jgi:hypothetical protein
MTSQREIWSKRLRDIMDGRPARWAEARNLIGDYDGRERTLEAFNADANDQRQLLRRLRPVRYDLALLREIPSRKPREAVGRAA